MFHNIDLSKKEFYHLISYGIFPQIDKIGTYFGKNNGDIDKNEEQIIKQLEMIFVDNKNFNKDILKKIFLYYLEINVQSSQEKEYIKKEVDKLFLEEENLKMLKEFILENAEDLKHLFHGYKLLHRLIKIEDEIENNNKKIEEIKLKLYVKGKNLDNATGFIQDKVQRLEGEIIQLKKSRNNMLNSKETVAAYEFHKICSYAHSLHNGNLVDTPSVKQQKRILLDKITSGQTVLLSGPVGTGKTIMAKDLYTSILKNKKATDQISDDEYKMLKPIPIVNGNEETTVRELNSRPVQMSNKSDTDEAFKYEIGLVIKCLKYGLPLIIDEANRTPINFLSALKSYRSMAKGETCRDPITGESFDVKGPLQVILTANEGEKYAAHTQKFQDQIEREISREYIGYFPENEILDLLKAKLYKDPGIAFVKQSDLNKVLPNLINSITEINELYLKGGKFEDNKGEVNKLENKNTVFDTKRFLELIKPSKIDSKETFLEELNQEIVNFISHDVNADSERKILCGIFHKNCLLWTENIPDLLEGNTKLTDKDLITWISTNKSQILENIYGNDLDCRFINPRNLAVGYGNLINRKTSGEFANPHILSKIDLLGWDDDETKINKFKEDVVGIFHAIDDKKIISKIMRINKSNFDEMILAILKDLFSEEYSQNIEKKLGILRSAINDYYSDKLELIDKQVEKYKKNLNLGTEDTRDISNVKDSNIIIENLPDYTKVLHSSYSEETGGGRNKDKMEKINHIIVDMKNKGLIEQENKDGGISTKINIDGESFIRFEPDFEKYSDDEYLSTNTYIFGGKDIIKKEVCLAGMRGELHKNWDNKKLSSYINNLGNEGLFMLSKDEFLGWLNKIREYVNRVYKLDLSSSECLDFHCRAIGTVGLFWLSDYSISGVRSCMLCCHEVIGFDGYAHDFGSASILLSNYTKNN